MEVPHLNIHGMWLFTPVHIQQAFKSKYLLFFFLDRTAQRPRYSNVKLVVRIENKLPGGFRSLYRITWHLCQIARPLSAQHTKAPKQGVCFSINRYVLLLAGVAIAAIPRCLSSPLLTESRWFGLRLKARVSSYGASKIRWTTSYTIHCRVLLSTSTRFLFGPHVLSISLFLYNVLQQFNSHEAVIHQPPGL